MRHFSCDLCGTTLADDDSAGRFVVRVEGYSACDCPFGPDPVGLDADHVADMADLLDDAADPEPTPASLNGEYDLCPTCYRRFRADPLGRDRRRVRFSPN